MREPIGGTHMTDQQELFPTTPFAFGPRFLHDHAGHIITDPRIAVVELVANSYDAGSSKVDIEWPTTGMGAFCVLDNGTGTVSYTHLRAHETDSYLVCRLL